MLRGIYVSTVNALTLDCNAALHIYVIFSSQTYICVKWKEEKEKEQENNGMSNRSHNWFYVLPIDTCRYIQYERESNEKLSRYL